MKNSIKLSLISYCLCLSIYGFAQQEFVGKIIDISASVAGMPLPTGSIAFTLSTSSLNNYIKDNSANAEFILNVDNNVSWRFNLTERDMFDGIVGNNNGTLTTYDRGVVNTYVGNYDDNSQNKTHWLIRDDLIRADIGRSLALLPLEKYVSGYGPDAYIIVDRQGQSASNNCDVSNLFPASDFPKRVVEIALDIDHRLYTNFSNPNENFMEKVELKMAEFESIYRNTFELSFHIVLMNIWETPDPYTNTASGNILFSNMIGYWLSTHKCLKYDMLVGLKAFLNGASGVAREEPFCTPSSDVPIPICVAEIGLGDDAEINTVVHEIGHLLGAGHPNDCCDGDFDPIMCQGSFSHIPNFIHDNQAAIKRTLETYSHCLEDHEIQSDCPNCSFTTNLSLSISGGSPYFSCLGENSRIAWRAKLCNYSCETESSKVVLELYGGHSVVDMGDFQGGVVSVNSLGSTVITLDNVLVEANECIVLELTSDVASIGNVGIRGIVTATSSFGESRRIGYLDIDATNSDGMWPPPSSGVSIISSLVNLDRWSSFFQNPPICPFGARRLFYFGDDLIIDQDYCFDNFDFDMAPESEIIVKSGVTLDITRCRFYACDDLWKGFRLEPGATLNIDGSAISNALYGIEMEERSTINLTNSHLFDNYIGLYAATLLISSVPVDYNPFNCMRKSCTPLVSREPIFFGDFYGNRFESLQGLSNGYENIIHTDRSRGLAGVWLTGMSGGRIMGTLDDDGEHFNHFENLLNGVVSISSVTHVSGSTFKKIADLQTNTYSPFNVRGHGIYAGLSSILYQTGTKATSLVTFDQCDHGITSQSSNLYANNNIIRNTNIGVDVRFSLLSATYIENNDIAAATGIRLFAGTIFSNNQIVDNTIRNITRDGVGIDIAGLSSYHQGWRVADNNIYLSDAQHFGVRVINTQFDIIENNTIDLSQGQNGFGIYLNGCKSMVVRDNAKMIGNLGATGIYSYNCFSSEISCNSTNNFGTGIQYVGLNDGTEHRGNISKDINKGLLLGSTVSPDAVIGIQSHNGNTWLVNFQNEGALHWSNNSEVVRQSQFFVDGGENTTQLPTFNAVANDWFQDEDSQDNTYNCQNNKDREYDDTDIMISVGGIPFEHHSNELSRMAMHHLYERLRADNSKPINDPSLLAFNNQKESTTIGALNRIHGHLPQLVSDHGTIIQSLETKSIDALYSIAKWTDVNEYTPTTVPGLVDMDNTIQNIENQIESAILQMESERNGLSSTHSIDQNIIEFDEILIKILSGEKINTIDKSNLEDWASSCPDFAGDVVFDARALLTILGYDTHYDNAVICKEDPLRLAGKDFDHLQNPNKDRGFQVSVQPNPVASYVTIFFEDLTDESVHVSLYDLHGKLQQKQDLLLGNQQMQLDMTSRINGTYLIEIQQGSHILQKKCVVIH